MGAQVDQSAIVDDNSLQGSTIINLKENKKQCFKWQLPWYYTPIFFAFWLALFFALVFPLFNNLPSAVKIYEESKKPGQFVAERAQSILLQLDLMGPKLAGYETNEVIMVQFLVNEIEKIRRDMRSDIYELELDVQQAYGSYLHWQMVNMYQGVQNVIVKLSSRHSNSSNYLLINSHYDSKPSSVGSGDAEFMITTMLEVLRQMSISEETFVHPIVFLFNGAEEQPLQGSHGFISSHKWSANCRAVLNLDSCGAGGRELLFQSGPNHPWLMRHYKTSVKHPFATTLAEEIFQADLIPSDTDFRIFRDFGPVPGLDMAGVSNGFVYHTKYDRYTAISNRALQNTGDNLLALVRSISNAEEMYDTEAYSEGHSVFFDFLGLFFIYYYESTGVALNMSFSLGGILVVCVSLWRMSRVSCERVSTLACEFGIFLLLAVLGFLLAFGFPLLMSVFYDAGNRTMTYFSNSWLLIGIFICPSLIGLVLPSTLYLTLRTQEKICHAYRLQIAQHAHCVILSVICIILTAASFRSAYLCMISLFFYFGSQVINLLSTLHDRGYFWALIVGGCQIIPFLYFAYLFHALLIIIIPMTSRNGMSINPDLLVSLLCALGTVFAMGFLAQLVNIFRRPKCSIGFLSLIMFIFCMVTVSDVGFPYRPKTNVMRLHFLEVHRWFYEYDGSLSLEDSGYYFDLQDRRLESPLRDSMELTGLTRLDQDVCKTKMKCGMPCFNHRWCATVEDARWLPRIEPVQLPGLPALELLNKTVLTNGFEVRYEFRLQGPPRMSLFVGPLAGVKMLNWSFLKGMLDNPAIYKPPYHVFIAFGIDHSPVNFFFQLEKENGNFEEPVFELGVSAHYMDDSHKRDDVTKAFLGSLPEFAHPMEWPTSYERYIF
ncbi:endoplasmic reticulum metallopeptidase 1 isoform X1 [Drosophila tropicalis]|uniref:endoplasmic reticulum metallopeptidase 1 isoform X1 n=2 Tax=Drosophila tropicalis TaxID=46794 RepID=UPI0035AC2000